MLVEYALRFRASAISSVAATSAFRITSNVIGSTIPAPAPAEPAPPLLGGSVEPTPLGAHPYSSRARSALTLPSRTSRATRSGSRSSGGP